MTRSVLGGALLLATLLPGRELLLAQQTRPEDLPEAPQPSVSLPVQDVPAGNRASSRQSAETAIGQGQKNTSHPGFPPVSRPLRARMLVPAASRRNIPERPECRPDSSSPAERVMSCRPDIPIFARFLNSASPLPLTARQKLILAARNIGDPFNLLTIGFVSAYGIASNAHTADGPGFPGFARNAGVSFTQDMVGEFFGTFLIPSLAHQDPHYHRMPNLSLRRRIIHVFDEVVIAQSDEGVPMFNYATVLGTIAGSALGNVYVPGRSNSFSASTERITTALATDPIGNAITEFLPDVARRVNFQVVIVQRVIDRIALEEGAAAPE